MIDKLRVQLKRHEGNVRFDNGRHKPYADPLHPEIITIGWGRNLTEKGLSDTEAALCLENDISEALRYCAAFGFWSNLNDVRKQVIANMMFNLGIEKFMGFRNMITALTAGDYGKAAYEMENSKWAHQVGQRADELRFMMAYGVEP